MRDKGCRWIPVILMLFATAMASAQDRPRKKLIEYGWDVPYPDYIREHIQDMVKLPFDGLIFRLREQNHAFDPRPWDETQLAAQFRDLEAIQWGTFTDNFLVLYAANNWGMDWFSDPQWTGIVHNLAISAKAARLGRCVGICFDPEPYGPNPWQYQGGAGKPTYAQVAAKVRQRGAQFMTALQSELPEVRILSFFQLNLFAALANDPEPASRDAKLAQQGWGLLVPFVDGMLEVANPGARLIDGNESAYYYPGSEPFYRAYHAMKQTCLALVNPANRAKYPLIAQAGMAIYVDGVLGINKLVPPATDMSPADRLRFLEHNTYYSMVTADEYAWCYSEKMDWYKGPVPEGAEAAIRSARDKARRNAGLGFDLAPVVAAAKAKQTERLNARVKPRTATLKPMAAGEAAPQLDGDLADPLWQHVGTLDPFLLTASSDTETPAAATAARIAFDDQALYLAFRCTEPKTGDLKAAGAAKDDPIWEGDVVEVFVSLGEAPTPYRHFIVNPRNVQWDGQSGEDADDVSWNATWQSATKVADDAWTAEVRIPWEALGGRPKAGSVRRANLCRQRTPQPELSTWSVTVRGFCEPERFGTCTFAE